MKTKKTYIKNPMVTRTITQSEVYYITVDLETMQAKTEVEYLFGEYNKEDALNALRELGKNPVVVQNIIISETKYRISYEKVWLHGEPIE